MILLADILVDISKAGTIVPFCKRETETLIDCGFDTRSYSLELKWGMFCSKFTFLININAVTLPYFILPFRVGQARHSTHRLLTIPEVILQL